jgi:predicted metalloprotease with PDZ domain
MRHHCRSIGVLIAFLLLGAHAAEGQKKQLQIVYTVELADPATQQFHVTTIIRNIDQPKLDLSLPVWAPGWYTIENYAKNLLRFRITDASGKQLPHTMSRKQTWSVGTRGINEIHVDYDYRAMVLALNQAKITKDFAFFTGVELFLQPEGHRDEPSEVRFSIPTGWKIVTALKETNDPLIFSAPNYDVLVDAPVELGNFDVTRFEVEGKPHYFVATPAAAFSKQKSENFIQMLTKIATAEGAIFGGLPYEKYVYFYFFAPAESNASGGLEHLNSFVSFSSPGGTAQPEQLVGGAAHEFFHLWNVKRIRPAEMWPYDYSRENETPLLWVSEGFTNYYGIVGQLRAGLLTPDAFVQRAAQAANSIENTPVRNYISPAEASISTWIGYDTPVAFGISYYTQGQNIAALLDLSIRQDTNGRSSLDDVMRALYNDHYKKGRGFTTEDMIQIVNRLTNRDYHEFYRKYVFSTEVPDYDRIWGYAGYKVEKRTQQLSLFGFTIRNAGGVLTVAQVDANSSASKAGVQIDDVLLKVNGSPLQAVQLNTFAGKAITLTVRRGSNEIDIPITVGVRNVENYSFASVPQPSELQLKIREGWIKH